MHRMPMSTKLSTRTCTRDIYIHMYIYFIDVYVEFGPILAPKVLSSASIMF